jgi:hypothetical protein
LQACLRDGEDGEGVHAHPGVVHLVRVRARVRVRVRVRGRGRGRGRGRERCTPAISKLGDRDLSPISPRPSSARSIPSEGEGAASSWGRAAAEAW